MWDKVLDWIAKAYFFLYRKLFQMSEPFTRIFCRIEQNTPYLFWGLILFWVYKADSSWWAIPVNLFLGLWFIHHIVQYRVDNPGNVPYKKPLSIKMYDWSARRMGIIK